MPRFKKMERPSAFRILAAASWRRPNDPSVFGVVDIEFTSAAAFLESYNGLFDAKVTPTHLVGRASGLLLKKYPEANAVVGWTGIKLRQSADVTFSIDSEGGRNLSSQKVEAIDALSLAEIAKGLGETARAVRAGNDPTHGKSHDLLRRTPLWLARPLANGMTFLSHRLGLDLSPRGPVPDPFGGAIITSIAKFGIETGFAALVPFSQTAIIIAVTPVRPMPWVEGDAVAVRPVLRLCCTTDHRIIDGHSGGAFMRDLKSLLSEPESLLTHDEQARWAAAGDPS